MQNGGSACSYLVGISILTIKVLCICCFGTVVCVCAARSNLLTVMFVIDYVPVWWQNKNKLTMSAYFLGFLFLSIIPSF